MIEVIHDRILAVRTADPEAILAVISKSRLVEDNLVWVNFSLGEVLILKNMGFDAPSPITTQYKWAGTLKPFAHQITTAAFMTLNRRAFCLNGLGTGKSKSIAWAMDYLMNVGAIKRALIICPLSVMGATWGNELFHTLMHRRHAIAHGSREKRAAIIQSDAEIVVINFDGIEIVQKEIDAGGFDLIVIDEITAYSNVATRRWKVLNKLIREDTWVFGMTGTPAAQAPTKAYGLAKLLNPKSVPRAFGAFRDMVQIKVSMFVYRNRPEAAAIVHNILQPAVRFAQEDCLDLPELTYQTREVPLSIQQNKYYKLLKKELLMKASGQEVSAANAAVALNKLLQISSGSVYTDSGDVIEFDISPRLTELVSVIDETSHKVLVFVQFKHSIERVQRHLEDEGYTVDAIHGGVSASKRAEIINTFQTKPDPRILVIQPQAASHGITLHAANCIIWFGMTLSLETYLQANARIHRAGQINRCAVVHLIGSDVEKKVLKVLEGKNTDQVKLLDLFKETIGE